MTPAQRKYDIDLVAAMQRMAVWIEPRSRKVSITLRTAAERIEALAASVPVDPDPRGDDHPSLSDHKNKIQPASTPEVKTG
jgi:hypothetical protein